MKKKLRKMTRSGSLLARLPLALAPLMRVATAAVLLRLFLGGTMLYAGVDKLILDP